MSTLLSFRKFSPCFFPVVKTRFGARLLNYRPFTDKIGLLSFDQDPGSENRLSDNCCPNKKESQFIHKKSQWINVG